MSDRGAYGLPPWDFRLTHVWMRSGRESAALRESVLEEGVRISAEPSMWLSPLPVPLKLRMLARVRVQRSCALMVPTKPDAEPDPGRFEVPHRVDTALAL